jgi:type IV pilus assembly protein PilV
MKANGRCQRGVGMVEILIALLVLAIGVLGYAGLQLNALKSSEEAHLRATATFIARDALERILANPGSRDDYLDEDNWNANASDAGGAPTNQNACVTNACSSDEMADWDIEMLTWQAANTMPAGRIVVTPCAMPGATSSCVIVAWNDQAPGECVDADDGVAAGEETECVVMEVAR